MNDLSYLANASPAYIEQLYLEFQKNPESIDAQWQQFFAGYDFAHSDNPQAIQNQSNSNLEKEFEIGRAHV